MEEKSLKPALDSLKENTPLNEERENLSSFVEELKEVLKDLNKEISENNEIESELGVKLAQEISFVLEPLQNIENLSKDEGGKVHEKITEYFNEVRSNNELKTSESVELLTYLKESQVLLEAVQNSKDTIDAINAINNNVTNDNQSNVTNDNQSNANEINAINDNVSNAINAINDNQSNTNVTNDNQSNTNVTNDNQSNVSNAKDKNDNVTNPKDTEKEIAKISPLQKEIDKLSSSIEKEIEKKSSIKSDEGNKFLKEISSSIKWFDNQDELSIGGIEILAEDINSFLKKVENNNKINEKEKKEIIKYLNEAKKLEKEGIKKTNIENLYKVREENFQKTLKLFRNENKKAIKTINEKLSVADEKGELSNVGELISKNIKEVIKPETEGKKKTKAENKQSLAELEEIKDAIEDAGISESNRKEYELLTNAISSAENVIKDNMTVGSRLSRVFEKYGGQISDGLINATTGLAGIVSAGNPFVMALTKTALEGTKRGILATKRFFQRKKQEKLNNQIKLNEINSSKELVDALNKDIEVRESERKELEKLKALRNDKKSKKDSVGTNEDSNEDSVETNEDSNEDSVGTNEDSVGTNEDSNEDSVGTNEDSNEDSVGTNEDSVEINVDVEPSVTNVEPTERDNADLTPNDQTGNLWDILDFNQNESDEQEIPFASLEELFSGNISDSDEVNPFEQFFEGMNQSENEDPISENPNVELIGGSSEEYDNDEMDLDPISETPNVELIKESSEEYDNDEMDLNPILSSLQGINSLMLSIKESNEDIVSLLSDANDYREKAEDNRLISEAESLETDKENLSRQERLIAAIEGLSLEEEGGEEKEDVQLGFLGKVIIGTIAFLSGLVVGLLDSFKKLILLYKNIFGSIIKTLKETKLGKFITGLVDSVKNVFTNLINRFKNSKLGKVIDDIITKFKGIFKNVVTKIDDVKKAVTNSPIGKFFTKIKSFFGSIGKTAKSIGKMGKFAKTAFTIGKTIGKIFYPITILLSVIDVVMGFIKGFKEDGIIGGIKGAIVALFDTIVGAPLDLLKNLVSWILGKLGFEDASKALDSFSFTELFGKIVDKIFGFFTGMFDGIMEAFTAGEDGKVDILGGIGKLIKGYFKTIYTFPLDLVKDAFSFVLRLFGAEDAADALDSFSFSDLLDQVFDKIFGFFTGMFDGIMKIFDGEDNGESLMKTLGDTLRSIVTNIWAWPLDKAKEAFAWVLRLLGMDDAADKVDNFSFSEFFGQIFDTIWEKVTGIFTGIMKIFNGEDNGESLMQKVGETLRNIATKIFAYPLDKAKDAFSKVLRFIGMDDAADKVDEFSFSEFLGKIFDTIWEKITSFTTSIIGAFRNEDGELDIMGGITNLIATILGAPFDLLKKGVSSILSKFGVDTTKIDEFSFTDKIKELYDSIINIFKNIGSKIRDKLSWLPGVKSSAEIEAEEAEKAANEAKDAYDNSKNIEPEDGKPVLVKDDDKPKTLTRAERNANLGKKMTTRQILQREKKSWFMNEEKEKFNEKIEQLIEIEKKIEEKKQELNDTIDLEKKKEIGKEILKLSSQFEGISKDLIDSGEMGSVSTEQIAGKVQQIRQDSSNFIKNVSKDIDMQNEMKTSTLQNTISTQQQQEETQNMKEDMTVQGMASIVNAPTSNSSNIQNNQSVHVSSGFSANMRDLQGAM